MGESLYGFITTTGRTSGLRRRVEIGFARRQDEYGLLAHEDAQWWRNLQADPRAEVEDGDGRVAVTALLVSREEADIAAVREMLRAKYGESTVRQWYDGTARVAVRLGRVPVSMETQRERFVRVTADVLDADPRAALVLADIGVSQFAERGVFERHPERAINVGIREAAMAGVAGGLALAGLRPVAYSYAPFLIERSFDQVKLGFTHQGAGGVLVSVGASYDDSASGRTHHAPGDVALVSTLPEWRVHVPGHPEEVERILREEMAGEGCAYIRLATTSNVRAAEAAPGRISVVRRGTRGATVVLAVGPVLDRVVEATRYLDATVLYVSTVRPLDGETLRGVVDETDGTPSVVVVEPYLEGTSAGEVSRALEGRAHRLLSVGVQPVELRRYGTVAEHDAAHGLDVAGIEARLRGFLGRVAKTT